MASNFRFSRRSEEKLHTVQPPLVKVARLALRKSRVDFTIISGRRSLEEQRQLVKAGRSLTMASRHIKGEALDFVPLDPTTGKGRL